MNFSPASRWQLTYRQDSTSFFLSSVAVTVSACPSIRHTGLLMSSHCSQEVTKPTRAREHTRTRTSTLEGTCNVSSLLLERTCNISSLLLERTCSISSLLLECTCNISSLLLVAGRRRQNYTFRRINSGRGKDPYDNNINARELSSHCDGKRGINFTRRDTREAKRKTHTVKNKTEFRDPEVTRIRSKREAGDSM